MFIVFFSMTSDTAEKVPFFTEDAYSITCFDSIVNRLIEIIFGCSEVDNK